MRTNSNKEACPIFDSADNGERITWTDTVVAWKGVVVFRFVTELLDVVFGGADVGEVLWVPRREGALNLVDGGPDVSWEVLVSV